MIHKRIERYENKMRTWLVTLTIPPNYDKMNNFVGFNAFGKCGSIYNPTG
jgi:hypothetical protein